ncbi:MAG: FAD-linked oxidase C-terminal domain-containing protein [Thermoanaerobaculia bacterium]
MILPFAELETAAAAVERLFLEGFDPSACEIAERAALEAVAGVEPLPRELTGAEAMLLVELDGDDPERLLETAAAIDRFAGGIGSGDAIVADDAAGQRRLWQIRRRIGEAVKHLSEYKEADTVVPRSALAALVEAARGAAARQGLTAICYGHAGDGNLRTSTSSAAPSTPRSGSSAATPPRTSCSAPHVALGGRITGEHGVGWTQRRFLPLALSPPELAAQRAIKAALDPRGILNPGKIFPSASDLD